MQMLPLQRVGRLRNSKSLRVNSWLNGYRGESGFNQRWEGGGRVNGFWRRLIVDYVEGEGGGVG